MCNLQHIRLHMCDQLFQRARRQRIASHQDQRVVVDEDDGGEILLGVVGEVPVERDIGRYLQVVQKQDVAVRCGARHAGRCDRHSAAAHVLDQEILLELLSQSRRDLPRQLVGRPTRGIGDNDVDDATRILLREARRDSGKDSDEGNDEDSGHSRNHTHASEGITGNSR